MSSLNRVRCEFCNGFFTADNPNMGTHRDYHATCETQAVAEGVDISPDPEPYQQGMAFDD